MRAPLTDDVWTRRGINVLWDGEALARIGPASEVVSLRRFHDLDRACWPEDETPLMGDDQTLVVAGLDVAIDALEARIVGSGSISRGSHEPGRLRGRSPLAGDDATATSAIARKLAPTTCTNEIPSRS